jgi:hypothetical protein
MVAGRRPSFSRWRGQNCLASAAGFGEQLGEGDGLLGALGHMSQLRRSSFMVLERSRGVVLLLPPAVS